MKPEAALLPSPSQVLNGEPLLAHMLESSQLNAAQSEDRLPVGATHSEGPSPRRIIYHQRHSFPEVHTD